jgi:hypothetical protein
VTTTFPHGLGRRTEFDPRSRNYPARTLLAVEPPRTNLWPLAEYLDQGSEGACVGFAWTHELLAEPVAPLPTSTGNGSSAGPTPVPSR